jgi:hypothetical protein
LAATLWALAGVSVAGVLFEDTFEAGTLSPAWVSQMCCQWVEGGWMHTQDRDGGDRDSLALVHDSDPTWTNYTVSMLAQFVDIGFVDHLSVVFRSNDFIVSSGLRSGQAYELSINGPRGWGLPGEANHVVFGRADLRPGAAIPWNVLGDLHMDVPTAPMLIEASLDGGRFQIWIDHQKIFDLVDPDPLAAGGVGVHGIWESEARIDNVRIVAIPEPSSVSMAALGVAAIAWIRRRRQLLPG